MAVCFIISDYFAALHGEKISKANIGVIRHHWKESICYPDHPHISLIMCGWFKGQVREKLFCQDLAYEMDGGC